VVGGITMRFPLRPGLCQCLKASRGLNVPLKGVCAILERFILAGTSEASSKLRRVRFLSSLRNLLHVAFGNIASMIH
jgi:hypothetical protein